MEYDLSFAQLRFWFLDQTETKTFNHSFYNVPLILRMKGPLNVLAMRQAVKEIQYKHDILRSVYCEDKNGLPKMKITDQIQSLIEVDLSNYTEEMAIKRAIDEVQMPFDIHTGPVWRVCLYRLGQDDHIFSLTMHHIISDIWSIRVFMYELGTFYVREVAGKQVENHFLPLQYHEFTKQERKEMEEKGDQLIDYWRKKIGSKAVPTQLSTDFERGQVRTANGATLKLAFTQETTRAIHRLCRKFGVTPYMFMLGAFKALLQRYTGEEDIIIGTESANRHREHTDQLIGPFVNQLVLRTDASGNPSFGEFLERVKQTVLEAFEYQDMPFDRLVDMLKPERKANMSPFFQIKFLFNSISISDELIPNVELIPIEIPIVTSPFDFTLRIIKEKLKMEAELTYNVDLFKEETMKRFLTHYQTLLNHIIENPDQHLSQLEFRSDEEKRLLLQKMEERKMVKRQSLKMFRRKGYTGG